MTAKSRTTLLLILGAFCIAYLSLLGVFFQATHVYAIREAAKQLEGILLGQRAVQSYVEKVQGPEIERLIDHGVHEHKYFCPKLLSFAYIAHEVQEFLNEERRGNRLPELQFRLATENPLNPVNAADAAEQRLLRRMNAGEIRTYDEVVYQNGDPALYVAMPIAETDASCLRCHGDPAAAPPELIDKYGSRGGFHEVTGRVRALMAIRIPLARQLADARRLFGLLSAATLVIMTGVFFIILFFVRKVDGQQQIIMEKNQDLSRLLNLDALTGIYNRLHFAAALEREINSARRYGTALGLVMIDLDFFKRINDTYGHARGDEVLMGVAGILKRETRIGDIFARWGGEEFLVATPHTDILGAQRLAEKLHAAVAAQQFAQGIKITASFGVTALEPQDDCKSLLERVDRALYLSKEHGRNRVTVLGAESSVAGAVPAIP